MESTTEPNQMTKLDNELGDKVPLRTKIQKHMFVTLKEMYNGLRHPEFKFALSGIIVSIVLLLVSLFFFLGPYFFTIDAETRGIAFFSFNIYPNIIGIFLSLGIAFTELYLWFLVGIQVTPRAAHYLVDNKILKLIFTKGQVHYLEYVPEEKRKIVLPHILNKYIALIIAWVSLSAFLLQIIAGILFGGDPSTILKPGSDWLLFFIRTLVIFFLVPIIFTLVYPVGWMLVDAKLKAYNSFTKLNWLVGKKVVSLTAGIITVGSVVALGATALEDPLDKIQLILDLVIFCIVNISLTVTLIAIFYNIFFQGTFYRRIIDSIDVGFGITSVTLVDESGNPTSDESRTEDDEVEVESVVQEASVRDSSETTIIEPTDESYDLSDKEDLQEQPNDDVKESSEFFEEKE